MFKNYKNSNKPSIEDRVKFLDISNVSKSPLKDIKNLRNLEKCFAIDQEDFDLIDLRVEGFINKYLGF